MLDIGRRQVITLLGGAAAWPLAARAQQRERIRRIGVLLPAFPEWSLAAHAQESGTLGTTKATTATMPQIEVARVKPVESG